MSLDLESVSTNFTVRLRYQSKFLVPRRVQRYGHRRHLFLKLLLKKMGLWVLVNCEVNGVTYM